MATKKQFLILVPAMVLAASCQISDIDRADSIDSKKYGDVTITASLESGLSTRTSLDGEGKVLWSAGDEVALMTTVTKDKFILTKGEGTSTAEFDGDMTGPRPFYLLYPYSDDCAVDNGTLKFKLPQEQTVSDGGSFGQGASPAVAYMEDYKSPAQFKNVCGAVELNLTGTCYVSSIVLSDLNGAKLWGDCELALDGKQGTDEQTLNITGGSNQVILKLEKEIKLSATDPKTFVAIVPQGSMSKGFTVKLLDATGKAVSFFTVQNTQVVTSRSKVTCMKQATVPDNGEPLDTLGRGYFKDVFQNGGCWLASNLTLPAAPYIGWTFDSMATVGGGSTSEADSLFQEKVIVGDANDVNGVLLYPDNEPRYRMTYFNGGHAASHGRSLTEAGRKNVVTFINNGGSYVGTCAGAYLTAPGTTGRKYDEYLGVIPGLVEGTGYYGTTGMFIPEGSPLLKYYNFGGDMYVADVKQAGGCYLPDNQLPLNAEILMRYDDDKDEKKWDFHNRISVWAYKKDSKSGRVIACGGHPEQVESGERRDMMAAMMRYACEGNDGPTLKATLSKGATRKMDRLTEANTPAYTRIGDKQYHHFRVRVPANAKDFKLSVVGDGVHSLSVAMRKNSWAWRTDADYLLSQPGPDKTLEIDNIEEGTWFISVYCDEVLKVKCNKNVFSYTEGDVAVLNGVPYTISVTWK